MAYKRSWAETSALCRTVTWPATGCLCRTPAVVRGSNDLVVRHLLVMWSSHLWYRRFHHGRWYTRDVLRTDINAHRRVLFSQPSIYIDGWLYAMSMTSVVCNVPVLSPHSVFTTWKWHPFATWTPSFIILVWGHHPLIGAKAFACLQNSVADKQ